MSSIRHGVRSTPRRALRRSMPASQDSGSSSKQGCIITGTATTTRRWDDTLSQTHSASSMGRASMLMRGVHRRKEAILTALWEDTRCHVAVAHSPMIQINLKARTLTGIVLENRRAALRRTEHCAMALSLRHRRSNNVWKIDGESQHPVEALAIILRGLWVARALQHALLHHKFVFQH